MRTGALKKFLKGIVLIEHFIAAAMCSVYRSGCASLRLNNANFHYKKLLLISAHNHTHTHTLIQHV